VFNVTGGEVIIILVLALIVLGPEKLPDAIRRFARFYGEFKKMSTGFQNELRNALDEPMQELRSTADLLKQQIDEPANAINDTAAMAKQQLDATAAAATGGEVGDVGQVEAVEAVEPGQVEAVEPGEPGDAGDDEAPTA
jgi:sec-independent protein translocase protein TatB